MKDIVGGGDDFLEYLNLWGFFLPFPTPPCSNLISTLFPWLSRCMRIWTYSLPLEIEIPVDIDIPQDDADIDAGEAEANKREEQKWNELDLEVFRPGD